MSKVEITDEMVRRAVDAWRTPREHDAAWSVDIQVREILRAALNPPPEPEIVVTEEMRKEGAAAMLNAEGQSFRDIAARVFRAMRKLEPSTSSVKFRHMGEAFYAHRRDEDRLTGHYHRRSTDPK